MATRLVLDDDADGIEIAKSGAPQPDAALRAWLAKECRGACRWECDGAFNSYFTFEDAEDARRFKLRWGAAEG